MSMYSNKGEINASSVKELLANIVKVAAVMQDGEASNVGLAGQPSYTDEKRDSLISRAISTQDGKLALAQVMANPIRKNLDYHGIARRALAIDPLN